ncbi:MAG: amidohydrolase [Ruminococcaceae bacterium]|nr:amidohydrolase [Oscillospiraceae bacterium]
MKIHFTNARIMPMTSGADIFYGDLITDGERIVYCGEALADDSVVAAGSDRLIDCKGNLFLPGFKNAHTHSAMTFLRSVADDLPLDRWLNEQVFPREAKLTGEDVYWLSKLAFLEYLTSGITADFDMYFHTDDFVAAAEEYGFRSVLCGSINKFGGTVPGMVDSYNKYNAMGPLISYKLGFHAEYTTELSMMQELSEAANTLKAPVYTHNAETRLEVEGCIERYGKTPTVLMDELGMFNYGGGGFHCVFLTEEDKKIFADRGLFAVTNPGSNVKLASGVADLVGLEKAGVKMAIGTDGPASNNCLDMFREMFLATGLQKVTRFEPEALPYATVLDMACVQGARAMGLNDCDCLAPGKMADLVMIDLHRPNMQPVANVAANLVYSGSKENVALTMIGGKILYEKGEFFVGEEPGIVYDRANAILKRIVG